MLKDISLFGKIESKYIYQIIFSYTKLNIIPYGLIKYSNHIQNKLNINSDDYKFKYNHKNLRANDYFKACTFYDSKKLRTKLDIDLKAFNIDKELMEKYISNF